MLAMFYHWFDSHTMQELIKKKSALILMQVPLDKSVFYLLYRFCRYWSESIGGARIGLICFESRQRQRKCVRVGRRPGEEHTFCRCGQPVYQNGPVCLLKEAREPDGAACNMIWHMRFYF